MNTIKIAITADTYPFPTDVTNLINAPFSSRDLSEAIQAVGGMPVLLPDVPGAVGDAYAEAFDALILPGGPNIDPTYYGEEPVWSIGRTNYKRDVFEMEIFRAFYEAGKPILGICRGCQLINIAMGGKVYQNVETQNPDCTIRHAQSAPGGYPTHHVDVEEDSALFHALGKRAYVNSRHHQAVKTLGKDLRVIARAPDGVVEAIQSLTGDQITAVQWHPENMWREHAEMKQLFADFVERVGKR